MAFDPLSAITTVGSSLLNFFGGQSAQDKAIEAQQAINAQNWEHSLYMANNSVQMKKADAEKAGISPLYAMGAPTMSFAPAQVGASGTPYNAMAPLAKGMHDLGQDVSRASSAPDTTQSKVAGVLTAQQTASNALDLESKSLQNQILKSRLALLTQPGTPPGQPFVVPENSKIEQRPPLMFGGTRWDTNPNTSPMKAWEDQYGDEGPVASMLPIGILANDMLHNMRPSDRTAARPDFSKVPATVSRWYDAIKSQRWVY